MVIRENTTYPRVRMKRNPVDKCHNCVVVVFLKERKNMELSELQGDLEGVGGGERI